MPVFELPKEIVFPNPDYAEPDGLLAIGGDLSPARIITAYANGIFPWYSPDEPILWWSPDPRCILYPNEFKASKSLKKIIRDQLFGIRYDNAFEQVIRSCANIQRKGQDGTWLSEEMICAYIELHKLGFAHSVEAYFNGYLAGGLYGIAIGKVFFGESMFYTIDNASKVALYYLVEKVKELQFEIIDNQQTTGHLMSLGAREISRNKFHETITHAIKKKPIQSNWK